MCEPVAFLSGAFVPFRDARLPVYDLGIVQGATVTERMRTFGHRPFQIAEHLERLSRTLRRLQWSIEPDVDQLPGVITEIAARNAASIGEHDELAIVLFVTAGSFRQDDNGLADDQSGTTLCIYTAPLPVARYRQWYREGVDLAVPAVRHIPSESLDPNIKTRSRMHWYLADREVLQRHPLAQALLLDYQGFVTETSSGNLFILRDGELFTPREETTLAGIAQKYVTQLATRLGFRVARADLSPADVQSASEAFLTSSTYCISPVRSLDGHLIGTRQPGDVTRKLLQVWSSEVGDEFTGPLGGR